MGSKGWTFSRGGWKLVFADGKMGFGGEIFTFVLVFLDGGDWGKGVKLET